MLPTRSHRSMRLEYLKEKRVHEDTDWYTDTTGCLFQFYERKLLLGIDRVRVYSGARLTDTIISFSESKTGYSWRNHHPVRVVTLSLSDSVTMRLTHILRITKCSFASKIDAWKRIQIETTRIIRKEGKGYPSRSVGRLWPQARLHLASSAICGRGSNRDLNLRFRRVRTLHS